MPFPFARVSLPKLIAAALAAGTSGCAPDYDYDCDEADMSVSVDQVLTVEEVEKAKVTLGLGATAQPTCEQLCRHLSSATRAMTECALTLPVGTTVGSVACKVLQSCKGGRRPLGHIEWSPAYGENDCSPEVATLAMCLASMAHLEAVSVDAFDELARQLMGFGAPPSLVQRCEAAAKDEKRHAEVMSALANHLGAAVAPGIKHATATDLATVALHNAVEGCVHETWAAVVARQQAQSTEVLGLSTVFSEIADDEAQHAQLAWDLHAWFMLELEESDPAAAQTILAEQHRALEELPAIARAGCDVPAALTALAAFSPSEAEATARALASSLGRISSSQRIAS